MLAGAGAIDGASSTLVNSIKEIFANPSVLSKMTPQQVVDLASLEGWQIGTLGRGSHAGQGIVIREVNDDGNLTGWMIQWHPGGGQHGPDPYWKVSSPDTGTIRVGPQFDNPTVEEIVTEILEDDL